MFSGKPTIVMNLKDAPASNLNRIPARLASCQLSKLQLVQLASWGKRKRKKSVGLCYLSLALYTQGDMLISPNIVLTGFFKHIFEEFPSYPIFEPGDKPNPLNCEMFRWESLPGFYFGLEISWGQPQGPNFPSP